MALLIALAGIWSGGVHAIGQLFSARFQQPVLHDIRVDAYDRLQRLAVVVHDEESTGDLMSVLNNDVKNLGSFVGGGIVHNTLKNTSEVVLMLWFVWTLSPSLALLLVVPVVLYFAKAYVYGRVIEPRFTDVRETLGRLNARIQDTIEGITERSLCLAGHVLFGVDDQQRKASSRIPASSGARGGQSSPPSIDAKAVEDTLRLATTVQRQQRDLEAKREQMAGLEDRLRQYRAILGIDESVDAFHPTGGGETDDPARNGSLSSPMPQGLSWSDHSDGQEADEFSETQ